jgi:hypothetical protein
LGVLTLAFCLAKYEARNIGFKKCGKILKYEIMKDDPNKSGYEKIYDWVASDLEGFDLVKNAPYLKLTVASTGEVIVPLLGRDYLVSNQGVRPADGQYANFNRLSLAAHYAMSMGRGEPSMDFVKLAVLSGVPVGTAGGSYDRNAMAGPIAKKYGSDFPGLEAAISRLGGRPVPHPVGVCWLVYALPLMPIKLIFQEADEEFEAEFTVLFDRSATNFMRFEAIGFLGGSLVDELVNK